MRKSYGVRLKGTSGQETIWCDTRTDANRVRRVYKQWVKENGWTGWKTLEALADLALQRQGKSTAEIIGEFRRIGEENSRLDRELE
jgi:ribonuclease HI